ncbi:MAG: response regulator [Chloroflexi bacterium]|nr:MAG: response regulator [Chloroflexota bacterium]
MQPQPRKKRVLIADTTQETRRNTRVMLSSVKGVEVVAIALDGTQAIEMARLHKPDIVLLDINSRRNTIPKPLKRQKRWASSIFSSNPSPNTNWITPCTTSFNGSINCPRLRRTGRPVSAAWRRNISASNARMMRRSKFSKRRSNCPSLNCAGCKPWQ